MGGTERRQLSVVKKPTGGTIIEHEGEGTVVITGDGPMVWVCGGCREPILDGMHPGQVQNLVFRCKACGVYNKTID